MEKEQYTNSELASTNSDSLTPYDILKSFRDYERHRETAGLSDYEMRAHEDGSVFFHNTEDSSFSELLSFGEICDRVSFAVYDLHRPLWRRILAIWR